MNRKGTLFIKDFVVLLGVEANVYSPIGYERVILNKNTILIYKLSHVYSHCALNNYNDKFEIQWANSFYPLFHYKSAKCEIVTPNYAHLFNLNLLMNVNQNSIREFIIFNTTLHTNTFHNEIKRLFGVKTIIIDKDEIDFQFAEKVQDEKPILKLIKDKITSVYDNIKSDKHGVFLSGGYESRINVSVSNYYNLDRFFVTWGHPQDKEFKIAARIAKKLNVRHYNIRPNASALPYKELLNKTGFLANMQYAYRYEAVKSVFKKLKADILWTGWGDINGYPTMYQPSELFSSYYLGLYKGEKLYPVGWNKDWLEDFASKGSVISEEIKASPAKKTFFKLKQNIFAPYIFGQVLAAEQTLGTVIAPWFDYHVYSAIQDLEEKNSKLYLDKKCRVLWKGRLYYRLLQKYDNRLNYIKNSKGFYPFLFSSLLLPFALPMGYMLKKKEERKRYPFDPVENKNLIIQELTKILDSPYYEIFDRKGIQSIIKNKDFWTGPEILEYFKIIQIFWFYQKYK